MAVDNVNQTCLHGPVKVSTYHISHTNYGDYMKRFVIDNLYIVQTTPWRCFSSIVTYTYPLGGKFQNIQYTYLLLQIQLHVLHPWCMTWRCSLQNTRSWELDTTCYM